MRDVNWRKEFEFAAVAAVVALIVGAVLRSKGAGKWFAAGSSGAIGGLAATAIFT